MVIGNNFLLNDLSFTLPNYVLFITNNWFIVNQKNLTRLSLSKSYINFVVALSK